MRFKRRETTVYHVICRVTAGEMLMKGGTKEVFRKQLWQVAEFSGIEVLAYCLMTNHLHLLVRVPEVDEESVSREELMRRYRVLYPNDAVTIMPDADVLEGILAEEATDDARAWRRRLLNRMHDVSAFMKTLKQRHTGWYNKAHGRFGTLWAERFRSVVVEDDPHVLKIVAAYIDLNPVRAGLVEDPADYRWSSYGEAMGGVGRARRGLASALGRGSWEEAAPDYRMVLFGKGVHGRTGEQAGIPFERARKVLADGGKLRPEELLRCRLRYLTDGAIFGSPAFVRRLGAVLSPKASPRHALGKFPVEAGQPLATWRRLQRAPVA